MTIPGMKPTNVNGISLEVFDRGAGDPVLFIHGGMGDDCFAMLSESSLAEQFRLIHFHRRGWGNSELPPGTPVGYEQQAADCKAVLRHLGVEKAHLVGQSGGGNLILQIVKDYPECVHSLALAEPALSSIVDDAPEFAKVEEKMASRYEAGDIPGALTALLDELNGGDYRAVFDRNLPSGWFERWVQDAEMLLGYDLPGLSAWTFTGDDAARIHQPVLSITGANTRPYFRECHEMVQSWIPHAETAVVPDATHLMFETNPRGTAERLADFFSRYPIRLTQS